MLVGWGSAVAVVGEAQPALDVSGLYLAGAGLGATAGILLSRRGVSVSALGATATVMAGGIVLAVEPRWSSVLGDARTYALALGLLGIFNVILGARGAGGEKVMRR